MAASFTTGHLATSPATMASCRKPAAPTGQDPRLIERVRASRHPRHAAMVRMPTPSVRARASDASRTSLMKVARYARYSSASQRDASIADQFSMFRAQPEPQDWQITGDTDRISGASLLRLGLQAMIADALQGRFQGLPAGAMDRRLRDRERSLRLRVCAASPTHRCGLARRNLR